MKRIFITVLLTVMCYCCIAQTPIQREGYTLIATVTNKDSKECSIKCGDGPTADAPAYLEIPSVVVIDSTEYTVTSIPANGFINQKYFIGDLFFPSTLKNIGESAFYGCSGINGHLSLPANCKLDKTSFAKMTSVTALTLPSGMDAHNKIFNNEEIPFPKLQILYDMAQDYTGSIAKMVNAFKGTTIRPEDQLAPPTIEPMGDLYTNAQTVTFTSNTDGAIIHYTTYGTDTISSTVNDGATLSISEPTTIEFYSKKDGKQSPTIVDEYTFKAAEPVLTTESELPFEGEIEISITCDTEKATIYYTTDGSDPTPSSTSAVYDEKKPITITVSETTTIKAFARYNNWIDSEIVTAIYTKKGTTLAPEFTPAQGTYSETQNVSFNCSTEGATIYYTTDGTTPTTSCAVYNGPITVSKNTTIKAIACCESMTESAVSTATYTITKTVAKPTFSPEPGNYPETEVSINYDTTSGVTIYYTIDGSDPITSSTRAVYTRPITIKPNERTVINAIAVKTENDPDYEWLNSELASGTYNDNTMVIFIKDGNWSNPNNWSSGYVPNKNGRAAIGANLTIANGEKAEIAYITNVPSTFYTAGTITIEDGGQLIAGEAAIENVNVKKEIAGHGGDAQNGWYAISTPMGNEINNTYYNNLISSNDKDYDLFYYNETKWYWYNFKEDANFKRFRLGQAYLYANKINNTIVSVGMPNMNPVSVSVSNTEYTPDDNTQDYNLRGFNLIGNPFTFDIGWDAISSDGILADGYYTLGTDGTWAAKTSNSEPIKVGMGILVQAKTSGTININDTPYSQTQQTEIDSKRGMSVNESLAITVSNEKYNDVAHINFGNDSEKGLRKIAHMNDDIQMVYVPVNGINYAIANVDNNVNEVPVSFEAYTMGKYTISIDANISHNEVYLLDKLTGEKIDILSQDYTFVATSSDKAERFSLLFVNNNDDDTESTNQIFAYINNGEIIISDIEGSGNVKIYDVMGRLVIAENANGSAKISTESFTNGIYIINLIDGDGIKTQKIAIRK